MAWTGLNDQQQKVWDELWKKYVPDLGAAETIGGEILRAMARLIYRYYNDGDEVGQGYGNETCNSSNRYLGSVLPCEVYQGLEPWELGKMRYEDALLRNHRTVFKYVTEHPEVFEQKNTKDSRVSSPEDLDRAWRYQEDEREWAEEDYDDDCRI